MAELQTGPNKVHTHIERLPAGNFGANLDRWKRLIRHGWRLTWLEEIATGDLVVLGVRDDDGVDEPDRLGQFSLDLD